MEGRKKKEERKFNVWFWGYVWIPDNRISRYRWQSPVILLSEICASGSVVEYRLAKARVAGSNPVSRSFFLNGGVLFYAVSAVFIFCIFADSFKNLCPCAYSFHPQSGNCIHCLTPLWSVCSLTACVAVMANTGTGLRRLTQAFLHLWGLFSINCPINCGFWQFLSLSRYLLPTTAGL